MERAQTMSEKVTTLRFTKENHLFLKSYCVNHEITINALVNNLVKKLKEKNKKDVDSK